MKARVYYQPSINQLEVLTTKRVVKKADLYVVSKPGTIPKVEYKLGVVDIIYIGDL